MDDKLPYPLMKSEIHPLCYWLSRAVGRVFFPLIFRFRPIGFEAIPRDGEPYLLICNHISHFDPPILVVALPRPIHFLTMKELFKPWWFVRWLRAVGCIEVDRNRVDFKAARRAVRRLRGGHMVGLFPEGGLRTGNESILEGAPLSSGAAELASLADAPVRTCVLLGSDQLYDWKNWFRRPEIRVVCGNEFRLNPALPKAEARQALTQALQADFQSLYRRLRAEVPEEMLPCTAQERMGRGKAIIPLESHSESI